MKIFMYSDLHISKTSSILPLTSRNSKYTYRQNMILETAKYLVEKIDETKPDMIINLGDTFDQHTITSYDVDVASEFFSCFRYLSIPHIVLVGNHEMINSNFNAIQMLSNINNITVIAKPCKTGTATLLKQNENEEISLAFIPYMNYKDILEFPDGDFLFSHLDIQGSSVRGDFELEDGVSVEQLKKYKLVFNGHIHKASVKNNVVNVGSITTHSFSDDNNSVPQCYLFDTQTMDLKTFKPTFCPLFRKFEIQNDIAELDKYLKILDDKYKYILNVVTPFEFKDQVKELVDSSKLVLGLRVSVKVDKAKKENEEAKLEVESNLDINKSFKEFLDTVDLKYPKELYVNVLEELK